MTDPHYPLEYIIGEVIFFGKKFVVTPDVLIPRLETEGLVRRALEIIRKNKRQIVIDMATGSGIIGVSCADNVEKVIFSDISEGALNIAKKNYAHHFPRGNAEFIISDLTSGMRDIFREGEDMILITNLPYIRKDDWENMSPDTHYEPELALFGGERTGFELYERLFAELKTIERDITSRLICIIEFGYDQREICETLLKQYGWEYQFFADYAGIERFCEIEISKRVLPGLTETLT